MTPRHATALACCYFVGWAIVFGLITADFKGCERGSGFRRNL